ncbi:MAG: hypothetical protein ABII19_02200 [Patescibacteria group bacterium]
MEEKMEDTRFTTRQVGELLKIEDTRFERGESGLRRELQGLINRLKSGGVAGKTDDPRVAQAKRYFDLGVGRELGIQDFSVYLGTIPEIPEALKADDSEFPRLVLVEPRIGLARLCRLGGIAFEGDDKTFVPWSDECRDSATPIWIRVQDGRRNRNRSVSDCRRNFAAGELGLIALQGITAYLQHSEVVTDLNCNDGHVMDLPGSVLRDRVHAAYLRVNGGQAELNWDWSGNASPDYGSASCRKAA